MTIPALSLVEDLSEQELKRLAQLLLLPPALGGQPTSQWFSFQQEIISTLPPTLLKRPGLLARIGRRVPFAPDRAQRCSAHKALDPHLIRRIFLLLSEECTTRLKTLHKNPSLPANVRAFVQRMDSINSLWVSPSLFKEAFQTKAKYSRIEGGCEACILAFVGGNTEILSDLRASIRGRRVRHHYKPRFLKLVECWIECHAQQAEMLEQSKQLGHEIVSIRKEMQRERRQKRWEVETMISKSKYEYKSKGRDGEITSFAASSITKAKSWRSEGLETSVDYESEDDDEKVVREPLSAGPHDKRSFGDDTSTLVPESSTGSSQRTFGSEDSSTMQEPYPLSTLDSQIFEDEHEDIENAIIDYYSSILSTASAAPQEEDIHPAFRNSIALPRGFSLSTSEADSETPKSGGSFDWGPVTRTARPDPPSPEAERQIGHLLSSVQDIEPRPPDPEDSRSSWYSESVYSIDDQGSQQGRPGPSIYSESVYSTDEPNRNGEPDYTRVTSFVWPVFSRPSSVYGAPAQRASVHAQEYQNLVGMERLSVAGTPASQRVSQSAAQEYRSPVRTAREETPRFQNPAARLRAEAAERRMQRR